MKVAICSGGTGGHMFPACALLSALEKNGHTVSLITDTRGNVFCPDVCNKIILETIRLSLKKIPMIIGEFTNSSLKIFRTWRKNRPDVVVGFGGMFTLIPILVAKCLGAKVVLYEQNSVIGKANRLLCRISDLNLSFFDHGDEWKRIPSPVRKEFEKFRDIPYVCDENIKIVVIGGSQGAKSFSRIIPGALERLDPLIRKNIEIIQQVDEKNHKILEERYRNLGIKFTLKNFIHNMADEISNSQLVICRSGASTLAELSTMGRPAILIPYPSATDNHQLLNAMHYIKNQAAWMLPEENEIEEKLFLIINEILSNRELLKSAASNMMNSSTSDSTQLFVQLIEVLCEKISY
ncbi:MAG: UDP-N-acetylglucosamine--N-acetylmuramyl-(pentapeptide) pyrophosphoryl-undecaprenol N-acetylglucosamine transferase [Holosporaceae bacterium]|nr:UDP-N-acetylglucosamine--N-acetylmuramyl-(pentapeptide) pyrophosphoryl-undecaprenol N-acetylglucosamine transferase [Holosporaceae bacterium]